MGYFDTLSVLKTEPGNYAVDVPTTSNIRVWFDADVDQQTLAGNVIFQDTFGRPVDCRYTYANRILTIIPATSLSPGTTYLVTLIGDSNLEDGRAQGIRSILGYPLVGNHLFSFTTASSATLPAPLLLSPANHTAWPADPPALSWQAVAGARAYQVELGGNPQFSPVLWATTADAATLAVTSDYQFTEGEYYWRVRAVGEDGQPGNWSDVYVFAVHVQDEAPVVPDDEPEVSGSEEPEASTPVLQTPGETSGVDLGLTEIVLTLPYVVSEEQLRVFLRGEDLGGDPAKDHGNVPFTVHCVTTGTKTTVWLALTSS